MYSLVYREKTDTLCEFGILAENFMGYEIYDSYDKQLVAACHVSTAKICCEDASIGIENEHLLLTHKIKNVKVKDTAHDCDFQCIMTINLIDTDECVIITVINSQNGYYYRTLLLYYNDRARVGSV